MRQRKDRRLLTKHMIASTTPTFGSLEVQRVSRSSQLWSAGRHYLGRFRDRDKLLLLQGLQVQIHSLRDQWLGIPRQRVGNRLQRGRLATTELYCAHRRHVEQLELVPRAVRLGVSTAGSDRDRRRNSSSSQLKWNASRLRRSTSWAHTLSRISRAWAVGRRADRDSAETRRGRSATFLCLFRTRSATFLRRALRCR